MHSVSKYVCETSWGCHDCYVRAFMLLPNGGIWTSKCDFNVEFKCNGQGTQLAQHLLRTNGMFRAIELKNDAWEPITVPKSQEWKYSYLLLTYTVLISSHALQSCHASERHLITAFHLYGLLLNLFCFVCLFFGRHGGGNTRQSRARGIQAELRMECNDRRNKVGHCRSSWRHSSDIRNQSLLEKLQVAQHGSEDGRGYFAWTLYVLAHLWDRISEVFESQAIYALSEVCSPHVMTFKGPCVRLLRCFSVCHAIYGTRSNLST